MSQSSKNVDPYACAIRAKEEYLNRWKTVGTFQERYLDTFTSSKGRVVLSMGQ